MISILTLSSVLLWVFVLLNMLLTVGLIRRLRKQDAVSNTEESYIIKPGQPAPEFAASTLAGDAVSLTEYQQSGNDVVLVFVSPHCPPCRTAMPALDVLRPYARQSGSEIVLISSGEPFAVQALAEELNITGPVVLASQGNSIREQYRVEATPTYCVIGTDKVIKSSGVFDKTWEAMMKEWKQLAERDGVHLN